MNKYKFQVLTKEYEIEASTPNQAFESMNQIMLTLNLGPHKWFGGIDGTNTWRASLNEYTGSMYD
jgi:hypothetical protein